MCCIQRYQKSAGCSVTVANVLFAIDVELLINNSDLYLLVYDFVIINGIGVEVQMLLNVIDIFPNAMN